MTTSPSAIQQRPTGVDKSKRQQDYILLDGSGSMLGYGRDDDMITKWQASCDAIDAYVSGIKAGHIHSDITIHVFDHNDPELLSRVNTTEDWIPLRDAPIGAHWGSTPLYDAIQLMGRRLRDDNPERAAVVILTDGGENGSQFTNETQARAILDWMRAKGWQVIFIGAEFNNSRVARALGSTDSTSIGVQKRFPSDATAALASKRAKYGHSGEGINYTDGEKQQFGGYLNAPDTGK